ncbi:MAG TPA: nuclear transport factor 2 family protein [Alphaproteobacteria bacterium]|jgi:ketosteroid isomerase-like protein|nr:nuclear transport factor 2 family protein [Alphaproteobacteria bacterium]
MDLQTLLDERAIMHGLGRFARILDGRQWDAVHEVFADDVTFNYGDGREQSGIAAMTKQFRDFLGGCGPSQHLLGSIVITVEGDKGTSNAYVQARHQGRNGKENLRLDSNGEYIDQWERRPEGWRIVRRDVNWLVSTGDMTLLGPG